MHAQRQLELQATESVTQKLHARFPAGSPLAPLVASIPEDADERTAMRFCIEVGPSLDAKNKDLTLSECEIRAQLAACFEGHDHRSVLLAPVTRAAYDPGSSIRIPALRALVDHLQDPAARETLAQLQRTQLDERRAKTSAAVGMVNPLHEAL